MADIVTAIIEVLKADAELTALAQGRVFGDELPADQTALMPRNAIVVKPSGGVAFAPASKVDAEAQRLDLIAYGATRSKRRPCAGAPTGCSSPSSGSSSPAC